MSGLSSNTTAILIYTLPHKSKVSKSLTENIPQQVSSKVILSCIFSPAPNKGARQTSGGRSGVGTFPDSQHRKSCNFSPPFHWVQEYSRHCHIDNSNLAQTILWRLPHQTFLGSPLGQVDVLGRWKTNCCDGWNLLRCPGRRANLLRGEIKPSRDHHPDQTIANHTWNLKLTRCPHHTCRKRTFMWDLLLAVDQANLIQICDRRT